MNELTIVFSPRAKQRLEEIADYLYQQNLSSVFVIDYLNRFDRNLVEHRFASIPGIGYLDAGVRRGDTTHRL